MSWFSERKRHSDAKKFGAAGEGISKEDKASIEKAISAIDSDGRVSVNIPFTKKLETDEVYGLEGELHDKGINFDTGSDGSSRDWELDTLKKKQVVEALSMLKTCGIKYKLYPAGSTLLRVIEKSKGYKDWQKSKNKR